MTNISDILLDRRTIRKYSSEPVDDKILNDLLIMVLSFKLYIEFMLI
jgi:nitroreductase